MLLAVEASLKLNKISKDYTVAAKRAGVVVLFSIAIGGVLSRVISPYMVAATIAFMLMSAGMYFRKDKKLHSILMSSAVSIDLVIVLILEILRDAVATAIGFSLGPMQMAHIGFSSLATVLYFPLLYLGISRIKRPTHKPQWGKTHKKLGILAYIFRALGFVMMFSLIK